MIELSQHIEVLLLENDCVIVPGLGGFVAHYTPAIQVEENVFLPPTRTIGFNPQLKLNDGLLVQSYMAVYDTNLSLIHILQIFNYCFFDFLYFSVFYIIIIK